MKPSTRSIIVAGLALAIITAGTIVAIDELGPALADPDNAACDQPGPRFGPERTEADHREVDVHYTCMGAVQGATIYLPNGEGKHPAVVWVPGAGEARRIEYGWNVFERLVRSGVAVLTYDKRGVGESQGTCCPGDEGHFNLLTADVMGAISVLRSRPDVDGGRIGLFGASQAGWIAPRAAVDAHVAVLALVSAPTVTERTANLYERLASGAEGQLTRDEIARRLAAAHPGGFDPMVCLEQLTMPSLWQFGTDDDRTPVEESIAILDGLKASGHDITVVTYPGAGHGLVDSPPTAPEAGPTMVGWIVEHLTPRG